MNSRKLYHTSLHLSRRTKWKMNKKYFYRFSGDMLEEHGLTVTGVYSVLLDACQEGSFRADLKVETIAKKLKLTDRTVRATLNQLEDLGFVRRVKEGRRTVYDVVPVLPPKERNKNYVPETYMLYGDTYRELLRRVPDETVRRHYQNMIEQLGYPLDEQALFDLRTISGFANERTKKKTLIELEESGEAYVGGFDKFTDYSEEEKAEFEGQLTFFDERSA